LIFQFVIGATAMALFRGYFGAAAIIVVVFLGVLAAVAGIARSL
jgi:hypothetical protein